MDERDEVIEKLKRYRKLLAEYLDIKEVILYGSYVHGTPREDSDIDVAIVVDKIKGDYFSVTPLLWRIRRRVDERIEPLLFEKGKDPSGFLSEISRNGIFIQQLRIRPLGQLFSLLGRQLIRKPLAEFHPDRVFFFSRRYMKIHTDGFAVPTNWVLIQTECPVAPEEEEREEAIAGFFAFNLSVGSPYTDALGV